MKKLLVLGLVLLLAVGCGGTTTPTETKKVKIGATIYKADDNFMAVVRQNLESYAATIGADLNIVASENDQTKQNEQIDTMIADGVAVLCINLVDPAAAGTVIAKAKAANIPLVLYNKEATEAGAMDTYDKVFYVGTDSAQSGVIQGQLITKGWTANKDAWDKNKDGKVQYVLLKGEVGHPDAEARTKYAIEALDAIGAEQLALESATWDGPKAQELMTTWLAKFGDKIEMVIANNDGMALGAITALQSDGYFKDNKFMPVYGVDAITAALDAIENGTLVGTVLNDAKNQAKATLDLAKNLAEGKEATAGTSWKLDAKKAVRVDYVGVDAENYKDFK